MRIAVGPAGSSWDREKTMGFYREIAEAPVDDVYIGEVGCAKRSWLTREIVESITERLTRAGKVVYLSSPALVTSPSQRRGFERLRGSFERVEINSPSFLTGPHSRSTVAGSFLNVCNSRALGALGELGIDRAVLPAEITRRSVGSMARYCSVKVEVIVHGHVPLALSRNCYTVRALAESCEDCGVACRDYPEGMVLAAGTRALFRVDGPLALSAGSYCLVEYLGWFEAIGVHCVRILAQSEGTGRIISTYRSLLERPGRGAGRRAADELRKLSPNGICNGWFTGKAGWTYESPN